MHAAVATADIAVDSRRYNSNRHVSEHVSIVSKLGSKLLQHVHQVANSRRQQLLQLPLRVTHVPNCSCC